MLNPLVSIIIPTFNRAHLIGETLDSVLEQTYQNWECIVVDDGSTDNTTEVLKRFIVNDSRIQYHKKPENYPKGGNGARNYGFELTKGEYVNWFDDDDIMCEKFIELKISIFGAEKSLIICSGYYVDENLKKIKRTNLSGNSSIFKDYVLWKTEIFTPSILFRRTFLVGRKLFDTEIVKGQEAEFFARLFYNVQKDQYGFLNTPLFLYRRHSETKSTEATGYNNRIQCDTAKLYLGNLERSLALKDKELIGYFYNRLIALWYRSLIYRDTENKRYILTGFQQLLKENHRHVLIKIKLVFGLSTLLNKRIWFLSNILKTQNINV